MSAAPSPALRQTPLYAEHLQLGARLVDFGGWSMPVQYSGIIAEHQAVRQALGVFDISHMGQLFVRGPLAGEWLDRVLTNNVGRLGLGECQYTFLLNAEGGIIDDLIVYRLQEAEYLLVVNASMIEEDLGWLAQQLSAGVDGLDLTEGVELVDRSADFAGLAVQGPRSAQLFDAFFGGRYARPARNEILAVPIDSATYYIARTGYTGEDGFEVFSPAERAVKTWRDILQRGAQFGLKPCGLGARDTLRLEMCYPLNGSDLSATRTPLEAGLSIFVDASKEAFIGREALVRQRADGIKHRLVPFKMTGKTPPPRAHYPIYRNGELIAETTSGTLSPTLGVGIGMAYIPAEFARLREEIEIDIRGQRYPARIEKKPLYQPSAAPAGQAPVPT